ncbi:hypothetical protein [Chryseobacterium sp. OV279]|uniref:hypothetical protein n=1 Tax=Chryseobacterium sp. OV279 TaxID=1500285 RepID=UPI00091B98E3|nr:hypothetical protein [Chryseobacterium sp. OV279]SHF78848.1 hypothetical protein SAMN02787100_2595 [Chryseobacterium sp. OV279]
MKILSIIILYCLFLFATNKNIQQEGEVNIIAKVEKIDSLKPCYFIYINSKLGKGMFIMPKLCSKNGKFNYKLKKGESYYFKLKKEVYVRGSLPEAEYREESVNDQVVWTSKMKSTFYEDCTNMCGLYIDNEGKSKIKK